MNPEDQAIDVMDEALELLDDIDVDAPADDIIEDDEPRADDKSQADAELDESDDDLSDDESQAAEEDAGGGSKKSRAQKRIDQLTREKNDARREADYAKRQAEESERHYAELIAQIEASQITPQQVRQGAQQGMTPQQTSEMIRSQAIQHVEAERFYSQVEGLHKTLKDGGAGDALTRLGNAALTPFEVEAVQALAEAKYPALVAKAIAGNEQVFERFSKLRTGVERARFIDRLDGRLEARRTSSSSAKPTPKVRGTSRAPDKNPDDMSQAEYEAWAAKQGLL